MARTIQVNPPKKDVVNTSVGVISYDKDNLYPNSFQNIIDRSPTAKAVLAVQERFIYGKGMTESGDFWKKKINIRNIRVDQLARRIIKDLKKFGGFALHFNYNALYEKTGVTLIPFEFCRIGVPDDQYYSGKILVYDRWRTKRARRDNIDVYDRYNPDPEIIARQIEIAGGIEKYRGQVLYFGENGEVEYPISPFESVRDLLVSEILMNAGKNSNVSNNFLASQIFVLPGTYKDLSPYPDDKQITDGQMTRFEQEILDMLGSMQGAKNTGALAVLENSVTDKDGKPVQFEVLKFDVQNFDKIHEFTEKSCEDQIIKVSGVPHILIKPTTTGFSTEILDSYYQFYNESTSYDRQIIEETMSEIFRGWHYDINPGGNYAIKPLKLTIDQEQEKQI